MTAALELDDHLRALLVVDEAYWRGTLTREQYDELRNVVKAGIDPELLWRVGVR